MSYLENGSTLRAMFRLMPPMRHDIDPSKSEVVAYIKETLNCDLGRAIRSFNSMRNINSAVLIFDRIHRQWRGCDWVPVQESDKIVLLMSTVTELKRDVSSLRSELRKLKHGIGSSRRRKTVEVADLDPSHETEQQPIPVEEKAADGDSSEWFRAMRDALDEADTASPSSVPPQ